jgi:hypothetical protein
MNRFVVLLALPLLTGCATNLEKQESACELATTKFTQAHSKDLSAGVVVARESALNKSCMSEHGYNFVHNENCPETPHDDAPLLTAAADSKNPACYVPSNWGERQVDSLEKLMQEKAPAPQP